MITILDINANYIYVNKFGLDFFGYNNLEIKQGLNLSQIFSNKEDILKFSSRFENPGEKDEISSGAEYFLQKKDGSSFYGLVYTIVLNNLNGEKAMLGILIDHSKYRKVDDDYIVAEENLRQLNAAKDKFSSIIAHDLKNPFNAIIGFSDLILSNINNYTKDQIESFVNVINKSSNKGFLLLENLLEWSISQSGKKEIKREKFEINELIKENIELISEKANLRRVNLVYTTPEKLFANADRNMINTVIRNLLSNALKFTKMDGEISVKTEIMNGKFTKGIKYLKIEITDTGVGIENENIIKLFKLEESFSTKGTSNETGTGLGLVLCKDFVEKNGGEIWASSELGKGSCFSFTLPLNN